MGIIDFIIMLNQFIEEPDTEPNDILMGDEEILWGDEDITFED